MFKSSRVRSFLSLNSKAANMKLEDREEHGFVAVTTALLMIILLLFVGLAVDTSVWYLRGQEIQRGADAAALAAVVRLPYLPEARNIAKDVAARNGFDPANVAVDRPTNSPRDVQVQITDPNVTSFFAKYILGNTTGITRTAQAQYVSNIELGSKLNALGTGPLPGYGATVADPNAAQNFFLSIHGRCMPKEDGDRFASQFDGNRTASTPPTCPAAPAKNLEFAGTDKPSYTYLIDVPCPNLDEDPCQSAPTHAAQITVVNGGFDNTNQGNDINLMGNYYGGSSPEFQQVAVTTHFVLRRPDGVPLSQQVFYTCNTPLCANGSYTFPDQLNQAGKYRLEVFTDGNETKSFGVNTFSLIAHFAAQPPGQCFTAGCPSVSGEKSMSVYANTTGASSDFYLAKLSPARYYRGKRVQIQLWDIGEGANTIQVLQPGGTPFAVSYKTLNPGVEQNGVKFKDAGRIDSGSNKVTSILVSGDVNSIPSANKPPWPTSSRANSTLYNDRLLSVQVEIPTTYGCTPNVTPCQDDPNLPDGGWWKIRYNTGAAEVFDTSTWTVQLMGDPVHLVQQTP